MCPLRHRTTKTSTISALIWGICGQLQNCSSPHNCIRTDVLSRCQARIMVVETSSSSHAVNGSSIGETTMVDVTSLKGMMRSERIFSPAGNWDGGFYELDLVFDAGSVET